MRALLPLVLALLCAAQADAAVALVSGQTKTGNVTTASTSIATSTNAAPTVGNEDIIAVGSNSGVGSTQTPSGWNACATPTTTGIGYSVFCRVAQAGDPLSVTVTLTSARTANWWWIELSGESTTYPYYAGTTKANAGFAYTNATVNQTSYATNGMELEFYGAYNTTALATSITDAPPSGATTSQLDFATSTSGTARTAIALFYTTTDPHAATQPYSAQGTFNAAQSNTAAQMMWIPPASYVPATTSGCPPYVYPCAFVPG